MRFSFHHVRAAFLLVAITCLVQSAIGRENTNFRLVSGNGSGSIKVDGEEFPVYAVVVKMIDGGDAEITLVSTATLFYMGKWSENSDKSINLTISGGATEGGVQGTGKLYLRNEGKSISSLSIKATGKLRNKTVEVSFKAT